MAVFLVTCSDPVCLFAHHKIVLAMISCTVGGMLMVTGNFRYSHTTLEQKTEMELIIGSCGNDKPYPTGCVQASVYDAGILWLNA